MVSSPGVLEIPSQSGERARSLVQRDQRGPDRDLGVPGFLHARGFHPRRLWPPGQPGGRRAITTPPPSLKKTLERLVDFDRINDLKDEAQASARSGVTSGKFSGISTITNSRNSARRSAPSNIIGRPAHCRRAFPRSSIEGEHYWDGGNRLPHTTRFRAWTRRPAAIS